MGVPAFSIKTLLKLRIVNGNVFGQLAEICLRNILLILLFLLIESYQQAMVPDGSVYG